MKKLALILLSVILCAALLTLASCDKNAAGAGDGTKEATEKDTGVITETVPDTEPVETEAKTPETDALATEPATEAATEPATEAATEPATEAATEPATEAATEPAGDDTETIDGLWQSEDQPPEMIQIATIDDDTIEIEVEIYRYFRFYTEATGGDGVYSFEEDSFNFKGNVLFDGEKVTLEITDFGKWADDSYITGHLDSLDFPIKAYN
ncbi:MAG: hypothetical protein IKI91_01625 [Clostridia bacterium]|nr:hypothetical protein [Clostridia bacterium]